MFTRLYIHIPFCRQKCPYCSFFSLEHSGNDLSGYAELVEQEMLLAAEVSTTKSKLDSIYFGGGTPSLLDPQQIRDLLFQAEKLFGMNPDAEITLEANPGTIEFQRLAGFRQAGITRLSLGIQSFDDRMLRALGRIHTAQQSREAISSARQAGFENIGIDLIHSLPGQSGNMWREDLQQALELAPEHLSIYGLTIEEDTPFALQFPGKSTLLPDEDLSADMYEMAIETLETHGYEHYEIANYARSDLRSRHNCGYWKRDGCLGLGVGAHSFLRNTGHGIRFSNTIDLNDYRTALNNDVLPRRDVLALSRADAMAEHLFLGLRMFEGVLNRDFEQEFETGIKDVFGQVVVTLIERGLLTEDTSGIRLTHRGMLLSNQVFQQFLP